MQESNTKVFEVPLALIFYDEDFNCRGKIPPAEVVDLAKDIDTNGLMNPILLQDWPSPQFKYRVVCGHRRFMAYRLLKRTTIPGMIRDDLTQKQALTLNLSENLKRKDLNMLQEAKALEKFLAAGMNEYDIAEEIGMSRGWVQSRRELLCLAEDVQEAAAAGFLTSKHIRELYSLPHDKQREAVKDIKERRLKGEKQQIFIQKPVRDFNSKKVRNRVEILEIMTLIQEAVGNNFSTRALAWTIGEISQVDLLRDLKAFAATQGKTYEIPKEVIAQIKY